MTVYLDHTKAVIREFLIDRKQFQEKFTNHNAKGYHMLKGTPLTINIEGATVAVDNLSSLCSAKNKWMVNRLVNDMKRGQLTTDIEFRWRKER